MKWNADAYGKAVGVHVRQSLASKTVGGQFDGNLFLSTRCDAALLASVLHASLLRMAF